MKDDGDDLAEQVHRYAYENQDKIWPHIPPGHIPPPAGVEPKWPDRSRLFVNGEELQHGEGWTTYEELTNLVNRARGRDESA